MEELRFEFVASRRTALCAALLPLLGGGARASSEPWGWLVDFVEPLERAGRPHAIVGSGASSVCGKPRAANDVDAVIQLDAREAGKLGAGASSPEGEDDPGSSAGTRRSAGPLDALGISFRYARVKTVVKTVKFSPEEARRLRTAADARQVSESEIVRAAVKRDIAEDGIDMVAEIGADFGCVRSGDPRSSREKLEDFGRTPRVLVAPER